MTEKKLVTVILPTIGRPTYIQKTLSSILSQNYDNLEILISDNLPKIPTKKIIKNISDSRIKIVERNKRHDFSEHMNLCINESSGFYLMILSDDDLLEPTYISNMVKAFETNESVYVGIGYQKILDEYTETLDFNANREKEMKIYDGISYIKNDFYGKRNAPIYTYLSLFARKYDILKSGLFKNYEDGSNADNFLFYSLASKGKLVIINDLMGYRIYKKSFGLSTPFDNLYAATTKYNSDISKLIFSFNNLSLFEKLILNFKIKSSSSFMLYSRLINVYKSIYSRKVLFKYKLKAILSILK